MAVLGVGRVEDSIDLTSDLEKLPEEPIVKLRENIVNHDIVLMIEKD